MPSYFGVKGMKPEVSIQRLFAFTVPPRRTSNAKAHSLGGQCGLNIGLHQLIADSIVRAKFDTGPEGAARIAMRLANAMDERSDACLLIICIENKGAERRVTIWAFPKDTAFQFSMTGEQSHVDILKEVFSQSSTLRKAAMFQGKDSDKGFVDGRIVDHQIGSKSKKVAGLWVDRFLQCSLSFTSAIATSELSRALRTAMDMAATPTTVSPAATRSSATKVRTVCTTFLRRSVPRHLVSLYPEHLRCKCGPSLCTRVQSRNTTLNTKQSRSFRQKSGENSHGSPLQRGVPIKRTNAF